MGASVLDSDARLGLSSQRSKGSVGDVLERRLNGDQFVLFRSGGRYKDQGREIDRFRARDRVRLCFFRYCLRSHKLLKGATKV